MYVHTKYVQCVPGVSGLSQKYAFIRKSTIFTQSLRNFVKKGTHEDLMYFDKVSYDWVKIVDFLLKAYFWLSPDTPGTHCMYV